MAGLDSLPDATAVARIVMAATGEAPADLRIVARGTTSLCWQATTAERTYAVLIELPAEARVDHARFEAAAAVLEALHPLTAHCPTFIATSRSPGMPPSLAGGLPWLVVTWVEGGSVREMTREVARDLGSLLRVLHSLPAVGFGVLDDTRDAIRGREETYREGVIARWWTDLWPYDGRPLVAHRLVEVAPHLVLQAAALREQLLAYDRIPAGTLCHADLHADNILVHEGRLAGLIDFNECAVAPPAFDLASFAHYHGWDATHELLQAYEANSILREIRLAEAQQLAVALALYRIEQYATREPAPSRLHGMIAFLAETLPLASRRMEA